MKSITAAAMASGSWSAIARAAGPATTRTYRLRLAGTEAPDCVDPSHHVADLHRLFGFSELLDGLTVGQKGQRLLERLEVLRADEYSGRPAIARHDNALVMTFDSFDELREAVLDGPKCLGG